MQDNTSRYLVRDAGWSVISASITTQEWVGIVTLGTLGATDQVYYLQNPLSASVNFPMSGAVNMAIKQYSASHVQQEFNARNYTKIFVREYKKIYDNASIQTDLSVPTQEYIRYALPLTNTTDLKISTDIEGQATGSPYNEVTIAYLTGSGFGVYTSGTTYATGSVVQDFTSSRWYITPSDGGVANGESNNIGNDTEIAWVSWSEAEGGGERLVGSAPNYYAYKIIVDAGVGENNTAEQVYTRAQYMLRTNSDIDDGTQDTTPHIGKVSDLLLSFVGDTLVTSDGVYVDNFQAADTNRIDFYDVSGTVRRFPFVATGVINFNDNLVADLQAEYFMFFTSVPGGVYGSASAIIVNDNSSIPITGSVSGSSSVAFTFDYDGNVQGGRTSGSDAPVTVVAIGLGTAQYVVATSIIERTKTNTITLVSSLERNYNNP